MKTFGCNGSVPCDGREVSILSAPYPYVTTPEHGPLLLIDPVLARRRPLLRLLDEGGVAAQGAGRLPRGARARLVLLHIGGAALSDPATAEQLAALHAGCDTAALAVISDRDDPEFGMEAVRRGLRGHIPSALPAAMICAAIALIQAGGIFIPPRTLALCASAHASPPILSSDGEMLTSREDDVLGALLDGKPNKVIAHELHISESTVKVHIRSIMRKLKATNRTQIVCLSRMRSLPTLAPMRPVFSGAPG